ncbi:MAG: formyltransferase family protein [Prosthecobacter sp.]|nr:formyltransferase family protein [Prosthecobacter sp.]
MIATMVRELPGQVVGIVRSTCRFKGKNLPQFLWHLWRQSGFRYIAHLVLRSLLDRLVLATKGLTRHKPSVGSLSDIGTHHGIAVISSEDINDSETVAQIQNLRPDLIVSVYLLQLIKPTLIQLPVRGVINVHPALLPRHRGRCPIFAAIVAGDEETGVTVHWVDDRVDSGSILLQERLKLCPEDSALMLLYRCSMTGAAMLVKAVKLIEGGNAPHIPQDESQATYQSWPSLADQVLFRQRKGRYGTCLDLWKYL